MLFLGFHQTISDIAPYIALFLGVVGLAATVFGTIGAWKLAKITGLRSEILYAKSVLFSQFMRLGAMVSLIVASILTFLGASWEQDIRRATLTSILLVLVSFIALDSVFDRMYSRKIIASLREEEAD